MAKTMDNLNRTTYFPARRFDTITEVEASQQIPIRCNSHEHANDSQASECHNHKGIKYRNKHVQMRIDDEK